MCHARRWHDEFYSPMTIHNGNNIYVNDFVMFHDDGIGATLSKVLRIFTKEGVFKYCSLSSCY